MTKSGASADGIVWDAHAGVFPATDIDLNILEGWRDSIVDHVSLNVGFDVMDWQQTLKVLNCYRKWLLENNDRFSLSSTLEDVLNAKRTGKLSVSFDIEGMNALNGDINMIETYHALGVRQMLFAYNLNNLAAGGCHDKDEGLTNFGKEVVLEMNRVGMIVDCSHAGEKTTFDIMEQSASPVVFTHSNPKSIWKHERNISDEQIKACAETGGVIGMNGMGIFLGDNDSSAETVVRHICHVADLVGTDHIGFGFDYSPKLDIDVGEILRSRPDFWPAGQQYDTSDIQHIGPSKLPEIIDLLERKGFQASELSSILGGNFARIAAQSWH